MSNVVLPNHFRAKVLTGNHTVTKAELRKYGLFVVTASATVTLPTPIIGLRGIQFRVLNQHSGSITIACTGYFPRSGNSITLTTGAMAFVEAMANGAGGWLWAPSYPSAATGVPAIVGGMVTGNTETGIAVTYQSADDTLDFVVAYGTSASTACEGNDARLLTTGEQAALAGSAAWAAWDPTLTWNTAAPGSVTKVGRIRTIGKMKEFILDLSGADGDGQTLTGVALATAPKDNNALYPISCQQLIDTTWASRIAYVDAETPGGIAFRDMAACTNNLAWRIILRGSYEIA